jgi:hypothetical protein
MPLSLTPEICPLCMKTPAWATNIRVIEMAVSSPDGAGNFFPGANSSIGSLESIRGAPILTRTIWKFCGEWKGLSRSSSL